MAANFIGSMVSIDCGGVLGFYQGLLDAVDMSTQALTIVQAFHNGMKCQVPRVTITAADIQDLKIVKDATTARFSNPSSNIHVKQQCRKNDVSANTANGKSVDQLTGSIVSLDVRDLERRPHSASTLADLAKVSVASFKGRKTENSGADYRQALLSEDTRKSALYSSVSRQSPGHRTVDSGNEIDNGRHLPGLKQGMGRNKIPPYTSPVNGTNVSYQISSTGTGLQRRNEQGESDAITFQRKQTTSVSDLQSSQKNGYSKGHGSKQAERHGITQREEDCFSMPVDSFVSDEFDFEKNLAMFDKRAVFNAIERDLEQTGAPMPSRPACATAAPASRSAEAKYRCDENVLPTNKTTYRQIAVVRDCVVAREYVTDSGLVIPSVTRELRSRLFELAERLGYDSRRRIEMVGRSTAEMVLQLLGGGNRFDPKNSHQRPRVIVLCGSGQQAAIGINCARHLISRNILVTILLPESVTLTVEMESELRLIEFGSFGNKTSNCKDLPKKPVDMIISALDNHGMSTSNMARWYTDSVDWANKNKASILAVDPPCGKIGVVAKWSVAVALPLAFDESCGQIYLCDLGLPQKLYCEAGLSVYHSPFAHKFVIPLHVS